MYLFMSVKVTCCLLHSRLLLSYIYKTKIEIVYKNKCVRPKEIDLFVLPNIHYIISYFTWNLTVVQFNGSITQLSTTLASVSDWILGLQSSSSEYALHMLTYICTYYIVRIFLIETINLDISTSININWYYIHFIFICVLYLKTLVFFLNIIICLQQLNSHLHLDLYQRR